MFLTKIRSKQGQISFAALVLLAALMRLLLLSHYSFWFDEAYSANEAGRTVSSLLAGTDPRHPPLYYVFLHFWARVWGSAEWSLRLPSALASLANLGLVYQLGKRLFGANVGRTAVLLLAFSPLDFWYAQEARSYMLVAFLGLLYATSLLWCSRWRVLPLTIILVTGIYLDYAAVPLFVAITAIWFVYWWQQDRQFYLAVTTGTAVMLAIIGYIPWWPKFRGLLERLSDIHIFASAREFLNLPYFSTPHYLAGLLLLAVGLTLFLNLLFPWLKSSQQNGRTAWLVAILLLLSLPFLVWPRFYTVKRLVVTVWPFLILAATWFMQPVQLKRPLVLQGITAVSFLATLIMILAVPKDDWRSLAAYLNQNSAPETAVWVDPTWNGIALDYYEVEAPIHKGSNEALAQLANADLWLVAERLPSQTPPSSPSEAWLDKHMKLVQRIPFTRLELRLYSPTQ